MMRTLLSHPKTAVYAQTPRGSDEQAAPPMGSDVAPMALAWAFAMVRSRAFAAGNDRFAFVPFLVEHHLFVIRLLLPPVCPIRIG